MDVRANILVDSIALIVTLVALIGELKGERDGRAYQKRFRWLLIANCLILVTDALAWLCDGQFFPGARLLSFALNTCYYTMQIVYCWLWTIFVYGWAKRYQGVAPLNRLLLALPLLAELIVLLLNCTTHWVFNLDDGNRYRRGSAYWVNLLPYVIYMAAALSILVHAWLTDKDADRKRHSLTLLIGMLLPTCGSVIESKSYGLTFTWPLAAISLLLIYLSTQQEQNALDKAEAADAKAELIESQMSIMLSQIQPHFLYNSLTVISELCEVDPGKAREATMQFSAFLRGNMNSLTMNRPIAFEHELQHTKNYLALEKFRFPDRLRTVFQIETALFKLPTLTLQPIVENAVRYGVTKRPEGGTVTISAKETAADYVITVEDDGVGFDPMTPKSDGRTHIGLANVRDRLKRMVNGTLSITSTLNVGTVVVITIPKGGFPC